MRRIERVPTAELKGLRLFYAQKLIHPQAQPAPVFEFNQCIAWYVPKQSMPKMPEVPHGSGVFRPITSVVPCRQSIRESRNAKAHGRALLMIRKSA